MPRALLLAAPLWLCACPRSSGPEIVRIHPAAVVYAAEASDAGEPALFATAASGADYRLDALWRWSGAAWSAVPIHPVTLHLRQERLSRVAGTRVEDGLFYAVASVNGRTECSLVYNGQVMCNDVQLGEVPAGKLATCVPAPGGATAVLVDDPRSLVVDGEPLGQRCAR